MDKGWHIKSIWVVQVIFLLLASGCSTVPPPESIATEQVLGPQVWAVASLERVGQTDQPHSLTPFEIRMARGEYESFQVVVRAPSSGLTNLNLNVSDLRSPTGEKIAKTHITLYREHYLMVSQPSHNTGAGNQALGSGWYADALIPFIDPATGKAPTHGLLRAVPIDLAAHMNQPFWVDIFVPPDTLAGDYTGSYTISSDQGESIGQIRLQVWNFTLPLKPTLLSSVLLLNEKTPEARVELLRHRLMPLTSPSDEQRQLIDDWGLSSQHLGFWGGDRNNKCALEAAPSQSAVEKAVQQSQPDLFLYNYSADEIDGCDNLILPLQSWARTLHAAGVKQLVTMTPRPELYDDKGGHGQSAVDIWVVLPKMYDAAPERVAEVQKKGDQVWSYNALVQDDYSPKWQIDFAPINFRIQPGFISQSLGLTGILYWQADNWPNDPWNNPLSYKNTDGYVFNGEGVLIYPGADIGIAGVAPSMRLKWLRDGIEDYEYVTLLKKQGQQEQALEIARSVGANWHSWTHNPDELEAARRKLAEILEQSSR